MNRHHEGIRALDYPKEAEHYPIASLRHPGLMTPPDDVRLLIWLARQTDGNLVEIGCHNGATTFQLACHFPDRTIYAIDHPNPAGLSEAQGRERQSLTGIGRLADPFSNVVIKAQDSAELDYGRMPNVTFVFIDGNHLYAAVRRDTRLALENPSTQMIAWHDYCPRHTRHQHEPWIGVGRLVDELSASLPIRQVRGTSIAYAVL